MSIYFLLLSLISFSLSKDSDCINTENASLDVCATVSTGTMNKCCYVSYTAADSTEKKICRLVDGATPQTILTSKSLIISELEDGATNPSVKCNTAADTCEAIENPTSFASCNVTEQTYPFSCCYIKTVSSQYCYPVNARYNTTVAAYASELQTQMNLTELPEITCSTSALPAPSSGSIAKRSMMSIVVILVYLI